MLKKIEEGLKNRNTIILSGRCLINYDGRVEAYLPLGDRIIIIKKDRTLLVHQPEGSKPINYMSKGSVHSVKEKKGAIILSSQHKANKEYLEIMIGKVHFCEVLNLEDGKKQELAGNEKDMSDMLYSNPQLVEEGFSPLSREEHTKYGFIDVFGYDKQGNLTIVECKRMKADLSAVTQLRRYVEKIKASKGIKRVRGIVAAPEITENALQMLNDWGFKWISVQPPKKLIINKDQTKLDFF